MYKFNINAIDLRVRQFRTQRDYWRGGKKGHIPPPKFGKPVITAIKLDPKQAILQQCKSIGGFFSGTHNCLATGGFGSCNTAIRAARGPIRLGGTTTSAPPS